MEIELLKTFRSQILENERKMKAQKEELETPRIESTESTDAPALSEVEVIERAFGKLYDGKVIKTELRTLLSLLPRKRERSDAYKALIKDLSEVYGVSLQIVPRWKLNTQNEQGEGES